LAPAQAPLPLSPQLMSGPPPVLSGPPLPDEFILTAGFCEKEFGTENPSPEEVRAYFEGRLDAYYEEKYRERRAQEDQ